MENNIGFKAAMIYGYSSTRVKAMESKLLGSEIIQDISKMDNVASIIGFLLQTDYKEYIEEFGGMEVKGELIDFALSRSLERSAQKLVRITPKQQRDMTMRIVSRSDAQNIKLVFYAKATGKGFDDISRYIIESQNIDAETIRRALAEQSMEESASKLIVRSPYRSIIEDAIATYKDTGNITEVNEAVDRGFYRLLNETIKMLMNTDHESATVVRLDVEMKNVLTLLRAKKHNLPVDKVNDLLLERGITPIEGLLTLFENSKDIHELAENVKSFDLKHALELYERGKNRQMLLFEISMRNLIFKRAVALLRHSTLAFGVILGYYYLKEIEVSTLRILINGKSYGLPSEQIAEMIAW